VTTSILEVTLGRPKLFYHCELPGEPMPWKRVGRYNHNPSREHQKKIADQVRMALPQLGRVDETSRWGVRFRFFSRFANVGDWDNLAKNICDALNGVVWKDDKSIREALVWVVPHERPRTELLMYPITDDYLATRSNL
jgi:Holliday junction resolvase RusA-like endonuclease